VSSKSMLIMSAQVLLAISAGVATAFQPGINAEFARATGHKLHGGVVNFAIGACGVLLVAVAMRVPAPTGAAMAAAPWWAWLGGVLGAYFVVMALTLVPMMGATTYLAAMVLGQLLASAIIDHWGLMGLQVHSFSWGKGLGIALMLAGVACVRFL
jgi:bacterial/archaeal transporter family-2 protein